MLSQLDKLGVNVASVVIGGFVLIICIAWVNMFKSLSDHVFFDDGQEGIRSLHEFQKKLLSAVGITAVSLWLVLLVYIIYNKPIEKYKDEGDSSGYGGFFNVDSKITNSGEFIGEGLVKG